MSKKLTLLTLAAACAAMFALPSVASAGNWQIHPEKVGFSVTGGTGTLTAESLSDGSQVTVHCTGTTGSGEYTNATTGTMSLNFTGCKSSGITCTGTGAASGEIKTKAHFTNIYLSHGKTTPGITISSDAGEELAHFTCFFVTTTVTGSINGHIEKGCNEGKTETTSEIEFKSTSTHGEPFWTYQTGTSSFGQDRLNVVTAGVARAGSIDATGKVHFNQAAGATCV